MMRCDPSSPEFLRYYAAVMTREADARPGHNVEWMRKGAERALRQAEEAERPAQPDLFAPPPHPRNITAGGTDE